MIKLNIACVFLVAQIFVGITRGEIVSDLSIPPDAQLVFEEDWSTGTIDSGKWYFLHRKWGKGNNGVVKNNVFLSTDMVNGKNKNVLICRGHGDDYQGPVVGWQGNKTRVGGVIVSKQFFASGRYDVVMKIGSVKRKKSNPKDPVRPIGMVPAIWTYAYRWVQAPEIQAKDFIADIPLYNPHLNRHDYNANEYWSEIDFPEFGKRQNMEQGLYNTFMQNKHQRRKYSTSAVVDGQYHTMTTIWRTHLVPMPDLKDEQFIKYDGYYWIQDKQVDYESYLGQPFKKLSKDNYAVYRGKSATHYIDGKFVGANLQWVPSMAAQLNIGVWFPEWGGQAPWAKSSISVASVKVWQYNDPGDVRGILTEDIPSNMNEQGVPLKR